jgi:hypothetical protein
MDRNGTFCGLKCVSAAVLFAVFCGPACVRAASPSLAITSGLAIDYNTRYVWRGIPLSTGDVIQPSAYLSRGDATISIWGDQTLTHADGDEWNETDYTFTYITPVRAASFETDIVRYTYDHQPGVADTTELTLKLTVPFANWQLFTDQNIDIDRHPGSLYAEFGANRTWNITNVYTADAAATFGAASAEFNAANIGPHKAALNMAGVDVGISRRIGNILVRPHISGTTIIDSELRKSLGRPDNLVLGISGERDW